MADAEDEEPVDPKSTVDEHCAQSMACASAMVKYEECSKRIEEKGHGQCSGQYMDFVKCVDACSSHQLLHKLK